LGKFLENLRGFWCVTVCVAKFFEMPRKQCKAALDIYKKFVANMEVVAKFLAVAEVSVKPKNWTRVSVSNDVNPRAS